MKIELKATIDNAVDKEQVIVSRVITREADIRVVLGEVLYGAEIQCHKFNTSEVFDDISLQIEEKFKAGKGQVRVVKPYSHGDVVIFIKIS